MRYLGMAFIDTRTLTVEEALDSVSSTNNAEGVSEPCWFLHGPTALPFCPTPARGCCLSCLAQRHLCFSLLRFQFSSTWARLYSKFSLWAVFLFSQQTLMDKPSQHQWSLEYDARGYVMWEVPTISFQKLQWVQTSDLPVIVLWKTGVPPTQKKKKVLGQKQSLHWS